MLADQQSIPGFYRVDKPEGYKNFCKTKPIKTEHLKDLDEWWINREEIDIDGFYKAKKYSLQEIIDNEYNIDLCGYPTDSEEVLEPEVLIEQYMQKREEQQKIVDDALAKIMELIEAK